MKTKITLTVLTLGACALIVSRSVSVSAEEPSVQSAITADCGPALRSAALTGNVNADLPGRCLGLRPLHYAAMHLESSVVERLLSAGAEIESRSDLGLTPLQHAAREANFSTVTTLLKMGANANAKDAQLRRSALHLAVDFSKQTSLTAAYPINVQPSTDRFEVVEALIQRGADVNARDLSGATPLHLAATGADASILRLLLRAGADPNAPDNQSDPPLFNAILHDNGAAVRALREHGADFEATDAEGVKVVDKARLFAPILQRFHARNGRITRDDSLSAVQRAEKMATEAENLKTTLEKRYEELKAGSAAADEVP